MALTAWGQIVARRETRMAVFEAVLLVAVLAVAAVLRLMTLTARSIWFDEAYAVFVAKLPLGPLLAQIASTDTHPPLYYLLLHVWIRAFGDSEAVVRALSVLFSLATVAVMYAFARRLAGAKIALLAALLLASSAFAVRTAQETRMYALFGLLALASTWALWEAVRSEARRFWTIPWLAYAMLTAVMAYTHYFATLVVLGHLGYLGLRRPSRRTWELWVLALASAAILFTPWLPSFIEQLVSGRGWPTFRMNWGPGLLVDLLGLLAYGGELGRTAGYFTVYRDPVPWAPFILVSTALGAGTLAVLRIGWRHEGVRIALTCSALPVIGALLLSVRFNVFYPRYFAFVQPYFALMIALALAALLQASRGRLTVFAVALTLGLVLLNVPVASGYSAFPRGQIYDWRAAARLVSEKAGPGDFLLYVPEFAARPFEYYFRGGQERLGVTPRENFRMVRPFAAPGPVVNTTAFEIIAREHPRLWVIATVPFPLDARQRLGKLLGDSFAGVLGWDFGYVWVLEYRSNRWTATR
jgi:uncharacterized membrane protein